MPQGQSLKELRDALGLTQKQVAEVFGCSQVLISMFELGKRRLDALGIKALSEAMTTVIRDLGSNRIVTYDEVQAAYEESRARAVAIPPASPAVDLTPGLVALGDADARSCPLAGNESHADVAAVNAALLGDLPAVDQSTAAPSAQGA